MMIRWQVKAVKSLQYGGKFTIYGNAVNDAEKMD